MRDYNIADITLPVDISAECIGLPTSGATITDCMLYHKGEVLEVPNPFATGMMEKVTFPADFYKYEGMIHPIDPNAPDIHFEAGLPLAWNGKMIEQGGGGLDGFVPHCYADLTGQLHDEKSALAQGYMVIGSDSGHTDVNGNSMSAEFAMNRESFENFAHLALKKVKDVGVILAEIVYGHRPERVYFHGGSNGGRECMKAIQTYPDDYDGAICFYPVLYWVLKVLNDGRNELKMRQLGEACNLDMETDACLQQKILELCGSDDGLLTEPEIVRSRREEILAAAKAILNPQQFEMLENFEKPFSLPYPLAYGDWVLPGYPVWEGTSSMTQYLLVTVAKYFGIETGTAGAVKYVIAQDETYDLYTDGCDPQKWKDRLLEVSKWLDACDTNLDKFFARGGKLILVQGTIDAQVSMYGTMQYVDRLQERYGNTLADFMKFYLVPGYAHGDGNFITGGDFIDMLDVWVEQGKAPGEITVTDLNPATVGRTQILKPQV